MKIKKEEITFINAIAKEFNCSYAEAKIILILENISYRMYLLTKEKTVTKEKRA